MAGSASTPNTFATQVGQVPASQLDANWTSLVNYINTREVSSGTLATRPTAPSGGTWYFANDDNGGTLYFAASTGWIKVTPGISGSTTLTAPLVLTDATGGGYDRPFMRMQETGSETWRVFYQRPSFFGNSHTLSFSPAGSGAALQFSLIAANGGQRVAVWDSSTTLPNVPHTSIPPTFAVFGDIMIGDIVAIASNPMTYFIRANTGLAETAVTQLFSAQKSAGVEPDGGAQIVMAPFKNGGGAVNDGYLQFVAYGGGSGGSANEIQFRHRSGSNTVATTWHIGGGANAVLYPDTDNSTDIGTVGNRVRTLYTSSNIFVGSGGDPLPKGRIAFNDAGGITAGQTVFYGPWATNATETNVFIQHLMPFSGVLRNFFAKMTTAPGAGQDYKYTIRVNATSSTIVATMSGVNTTVNNQANSVAVNKGDFVTLQVTASSAAAGSTGVAAIEIDPV